ncbi:MAG TPA: radical SAM protein [Acidobacteriaceae bacterium]|nr:radical SAM protein [Acidobacteriaceae bacterium]
MAHSYHLSYDPKQVRKMQPYPPLGTLYAATALREHGFSAAVFDPMLQDPIRGFLEILLQQKPAIVAVYEDDFNFLSKMCLTRMRELAWQLAQIGRDAGAIVIAHGSDATDHAKEYLQNGADFVLVGEAEQSLVELCASILAGGALSKEIAGVIHLDAEGKLCQSSVKSPLNANWKNLVKPARELVDLEPYRDAWVKAHGYFSTNVVASRGCPYRCNWCAKPISGNKFQLRPPQLVADEIRELKEVYGVEHIWFGDDIFALNLHWVKQFADEIEARNCALPFKIQSRADLMSVETVAALKRAGCAEVWMGVESGSQRVLDSMDKALRVAEVESARARLKDAGIRACYFLQFGYPGEHWEDIQQTIALVRNTRPDDIGVSFSYPLPGTAFFDRVQEQIGSKKNWTDSDDLCLMFKAAYKNEFYLSVRNALHAEVDSWHSNDPKVDLISLWNKVFALEKTSKESEATSFAPYEASASGISTDQLVHLQAAQPSR